MNWSRGLNTAANVTILAVAAYLVARPGGLVSQLVAPRLEAARQRRFITAHWDSIAAQASTLQPSAHAKLTLIEFADYQCPYCQRQEQMFPDLVRQHPDVEWLFVQFPLSIHQYAEPAARAALCAGDQGRFREMHTTLFAAAHDWPKGMDWTAYARAAGVADLGAFSACLADGRTTARLKRSLDLAHGLNLKGTPSFVYHGGVHQGVLNDSTLRALLAAK